MGNISLANLVASAVVAAAVTAVFQFFGAYLDRKSRRRLELIKLAHALANAKSERIVRMVEKWPDKYKATLTDDVYTMEDYFQALLELSDTGKLSAATLAKNRKPGDPPPTP